MQLTCLLTVSQRRRLCRSVLVPTLLVTSLASAGPTTAPGEAGSEPIELRVFRILAMGGALGHDAYADRATLDDATRAELLKLIGAHRDRVDREVARLRAQSPLPPYDALVERASALGQEFDQTTMAPWFEAHPNAVQALQEQSSLTEAAWTVLAHDRQKLLDAWSAARGDKKKLPEARKMVDDAYASMVKLNDDAQRQQEAQKLPAQQRRVVQDVVMYEGQMKILESGQRVYRGLRDLLDGPRQRQAFDALLLGMELPEPDDR
jgi:hypothetical protein